MFPRIPLFKSRYTRELEKAAELVQPSEELNRKVLGTVLGAAGVAAAVTTVGVVAGSIASKGLSAYRAAMLKTVGSVVATTVGVTAVGVAGVNLLVPPSIGDVAVEQVDWGRAAIVVQTDVLVRSRTVTVRWEQGDAVEATKRRDGLFEVEVSRNGDYLVEVIGQGGRAEATVQVQGIDDEIPVMVNYMADGGQVRIYFTDRQSGVDWGSLYATDPSGGTVRPLEINAGEGYATFPVAGGDLQVYVQDLAGNSAVCPMQMG